jgi:predicted MFS family arabinose efflux permease
MTETRAAGGDTGQRLFTRSFALLAAAELAYFVAEGIGIYALPLYVTGPVGSDHAGAGLAFGAFAVSALVLRPFAGRLSDALGRRPLMVAGALILAAGMALTATASTLPAVVLLRLLLGVAEAAFLVAAIAAVVDLAPSERLGEATSYNSLGLYLGLAFGPPLGAILVNAGGFPLAWYTAGALGLVSAMTVLAIPETRVPAVAAAEPVPLLLWRVVPVGVGFLASIVAMGGFLAFVALRATEVGLANPSLPLVGYGLVVVVCRVAFARVPDRYPPLAVGVGALVMIAAGLATAAAWQSSTGLLAGTVIMAVGVAFSTPAFVTAMFAMAGPNERGAASATMSIVLDLGIGFGPVLLGLVAQAWSIPWTFALGAAVALAGAAWTVGRIRHT